MSQRSEFADVCTRPSECRRRKASYPGTSLSPPGPRSPPASGFPGWPECSAASEGRQASGGRRWPGAVGGRGGPGGAAGRPGRGAGVTASAAKAASFRSGAGGRCPRQLSGKPEHRQEPPHRVGLGHRAHDPARAGTTRTDEDINREHAAEKGGPPPLGAGVIGFRLHPDRQPGNTARISMSRRMPTDHVPQLADLEAGQNRSRDLGQGDGGFVAAFPECGAGQSPVRSRPASSRPSGSTDLPLGFGPAQAHAGRRPWPLQISPLLDVDRHRWRRHG